MDSRAPGCAGRILLSMSETTEAPAAETPSLNGTAPAAEEQPCTDCVSGGEKAMALIAGLFGAFVILMAIDMFTGGRVSGAIAERAAGE